MSEETEEIKALFLEVAPVGSWVTVDPPPMDTDEDFLCFARQDLSDLLIGRGFTREGSPEFYTGNDNGGFRSWRKGDINLIVTEDHEFFQLFLTATHLAKVFNLKRKDERIALFQAVLYGAKYENLRV